jgi:hypothetical protein
MTQSESTFLQTWRTGLVVFLAMGLLGSNLIGLSAQDQPLPPKAPAKATPREWQWKTGDEVFQLVIVEKQSKFSVQGLPLESNIRYKLLSRLSMRVSPLDNSLTIKQKVETTKLEEADELSKSLLTTMLKDLTGKTLTIRVGTDGEIVSIEGVPEPMAQAVGNGLDFRGAILTSLIDRDGWKEMTRATLFTPQKPLAEGANWEETMSHSWGDLGSWRGQTLYESKGQSEGLSSIGYAHDLVYQPPMRAGQNNLPFKITNPAFRAKAAHGTLLFDAAKGRLSSMEENFQVVGQMTIEIAGQSLPLQLEETQHFELELLDKKPGPDARPVPGARK